MSSAFVIDDSISVCIAIERMLKDHGFEVTTARSGKEALEHLGAQRPDIVICDLVLPDIDGTEICSYIRREPRLADVPVIAISGLVDEHVKAGAEKAGAVHLIKKPFSSEDLLHCVETTLRETGPETESPKAATDSGASVGFAQGELKELVEEIRTLPSLRFGLIVRMDGRVEMHFGERPSAEMEGVVEALIDLVRRSAAVAEWLGQTDPHQLVFQAEDGIICSQRYGDNLIVLALAESAVLGKARLALARLRRRADRRARNPQPAS